MKVRSLRTALSAFAVVIAASACGPTPGETVTAPTAPPTMSLAGTPMSPESVPDVVTGAPPTAGAATQPASAFTVAVIVDMQSEPVRREQAQAMITEASGFLQPLTSISLVLTDFVEDAGGGSTNDMASRYVTSHAAAVPNGLVIFSFGDSGRAKLEGGYGYALAGPAGFRNVFVSPVAGSGQIYVAVVHSSHKYAPCGYDGADSVQGSTSIGSECRGQPGMACTQHNGYSICSDSVTHLYASTPTYAVSGTIIHELLHLFSGGGDRDHYNTPECNSRMGYPAQFFDLQEAQYHNGLCPYVYEEFSAAFRP